MRLELNIDLQITGLNSAEIAVILFGGHVIDRSVEKVLGKVAARAAQA